MANVANLLTKQLERELEYSTLNCYSSTLSAYHPEIEGYKIDLIIKQIQLKSTKAQVFRYMGRRNSPRVHKRIGKERHSDVNVTSICLQRVRASQGKSNLDDS